ncbi:hypothetical protein [Polaromonas aquatica]|uniref:Uncharacterized protein n=1 Tax=Polaromonas aquatica TaxID=332657 RepID=A0ABW1TXL6_9BURK
MNSVSNIGTVARQDRLLAQGGAAVWAINALAPKTPNAWLNEIIRNKPYESIALSIWTHQPNLRVATEKLGAYLTPLWPAPDGQSLWSEAIEKAVTKVDLAVQRGESYHGRVVGIYLFWLASCVRDVARISVHGYNKHGERIIWKYFSQPLSVWVKANGIDHIEAVLVDEDPAEEVTAGLRTHLVASITDPVDAGYLEMYAPRG